MFKKQMRTRSHILKEESMRAFIEAIPTAWVTQEQNPDYGLDILVQIFKDSLPTQFYFFVQLKGSDVIAKNERKATYDFETKHLRQYVENPLPVMLVIYDSKQNRLFYEWVDDVFYPSPIEFKRKLYLQKSISITLRRRLDNLSPSILETEVKHHCYKLGTYKAFIPNEFIITISTDFNKDFERKLLTKLVNWLEGNADSNFIKIRKIKDCDGTIAIKSKPLSLCLIYLNKKITLKLKKKGKGKISLDDMLATLKIATSMMLSNSGLPHAALNLIKMVAFEKHILSSDAKFLLSLPSLALQYASTNRVSEALDVAEQLLSKGYLACAQNIAGAAIANASCPNFHYQKYRHFLKTAIENIKNRLIKAALHYSLANNLRHESFFKEAIHHYHQAALNNAKYRERSYWWAELGGCFFISHKFNWSEKCYRKAIKLGEKVLPVRALLGDVLFYKGYFKKSKKEFDKYFKETKKPIAEYFLKRWLSCFISRKFGDTQRKPLKSTLLIEDALKENNEDMKCRILFKAIKADPLCGLAWYNYAAYISKKEQDERYWEWLITSILQNWDIEAWANTLLLMATEKTRPQLGILIAATYEAFRLHGNSLESEIISRLPLQLKGKKEELAKIISDIRNAAMLSNYALVEQKPKIFRYVSAKS